MQWLYECPLSCGLLVCCDSAGQKDNSKDLEKEEMFRQQQELLEARRTGRTLQDASARRQKVSVGSWVCPPHLCSCCAAACAPAHALVG